LRWAPDFADRERAVELAAIDAGAPWSINRECNTAINAETRTWDATALLDACAFLPVPALLAHGAEDPRPAYAPDDLREYRTPHRRRVIHGPTTYRSCPFTRAERIASTAPMSAIERSARVAAPPALR
jgi:proline iminopeptidase